LWLGFKKIFKKKDKQEVEPKTTKNEETVEKPTENTPTNTTKK